MSRKTRVLILGGGMSGVACALALSSGANRERFQVTLCEAARRLGGKGASVVEAHGPGRILEHGLHVWMGFYENAFRLMREVYAELDRPRGAPLATWRDAFSPHDLIAWSERLPGGGASPWLAPFARNTLTPGDGAPIPTPTALLLALAPRMLEQWIGMRRAGLGDAAPSVPRILAEAAGVVPIAVLRRLGGPTARGGRLDAFARRPALAAAGEQRAAGDDVCRRLLIGLDLFATIARGMVRDGVLESGFEVLDTEDYRAWLRRHGASALTLDSALVRAAYEYVFASDLAAGVALRLLLRTLFAYRGAVAWKMNAGMGETVFAPACEALLRRGVDVRLGARVTAVGLDAARRGVATVELQESPPKRALVDVRGLPVWLDDAGSRASTPTRRELRAGTDFDEVVLAASLGDLDRMAPRVVRASPALQRVLTAVPTTATQAVQLWLRRGTHAMGFAHGRPLLTAHTPPLATWLDSTHTLRREAWSGDDAPRSLAYLCGPLAAGASAQDAAADFLDRGARTLWPGLGPKDVRSAYVRANTQGSERYVLSPAGTTAARPRAHESGLERLTLAGDWLRTGLDVGCIEAATLGGLQAARALGAVVPRLVGESDFV